MKRFMEILGAAAFIAALGIVGEVERGADMKMMWRTLPLIAVMAVAAGVQEFRHGKNFLCEVVTKSEN